MKSNSIFTFLVCVLITACQSSPHEAFADLPIGAKKSVVLDTLGSPNRTYRKDGVDRWVYKQESKSGVVIFKELWIKDGVVIRKEIPEQSAKPTESDFEELK